MLVIEKLNGRKDSILKGFVCDIIRLSKEPEPTICSKLATQTQE